MKVPETKVDAGEVDHAAALERHKARLCADLLLLRAEDEVREFMLDLCTPAEFRALAERWHVAKLLNAGEMSYRDINARTGVSTTTIARVARFLNDEPNNGYRRVLDRIENGAGK